MRKSRDRITRPDAWTVALCVTALLVATEFAATPASMHIAHAFTPRWVKGDFHTHTWLTDGSVTHTVVARKAFRYFGLDWFANSEHGGVSARDPNGVPFPAPVPRWRTLALHSFPIVGSLRDAYPTRGIVQGVEWNVPAHDHASVGIVVGEPGSISDFEYMFDRSDTDTSRDLEGLAKQNVAHADAVAAIAWLRDNYPTTSYVVLNHPSRRQEYSAADIRDLNNAAPDSVVGFEGVPGHQRATYRGGYDRLIMSGPDADTAATDRARTYGGADIMLAEVGGVWDSLLGEGRRFYVFGNSDFHGPGGDFWPGEYTKTYTWMRRPGRVGIVDGLRSGNSFTVMGDLIDGLRFTAGNAAGRAVTMGQRLVVPRGSDYFVRIAIHSPSINNHKDRPSVHHVDLVRGEVTAVAATGTPSYESTSNPTAKVGRRYARSNWVATRDGWRRMACVVINARKDMYFRLRGTNLRPGMTGETDAQGNPLMDALAGENTPDTAYADLWFYSNPLYIDVR